MRHRCLKMLNIIFIFSQHLTFYLFYNTFYVLAILQLSVNIHNIIMEQYSLTIIIIIAYFLCIIKNHTKTFYSSQHGMHSPIQLILLFCIRNDFQKECLSVGYRIGGSFCCGWTSPNSTIFPSEKTQAYVFRESNESK